ncbi:hypothetical protein [Psychrobacter pygoscelis]|uniref:hypothetical protein n=1 Tax=Psychrobacter pygoscelis TaxID=2488563 RepID=UPI0010389171|nr:hypothetical protein [Psychrobacter pygoscelis]
MKTLTGIVLLGAALALSACGGDSDSSGSSSTSSFKSTIANGNQYSCPSEAAMKTCKTDSQCKADKCTLTKKVTTPSDTTTTTACKISGKTVTGYNNKSCKFVNSKADANIIITCTSGQMQLDGNVGNFNSSGGTISSGTPINDYILQCP